MDNVKTRSAGFAKLSRRDPAPRVRTIVAEVIRQLDVRLSEEQVAAIVAAAVYHERVRPHIDQAFGRILDRLDPSVVVMDGASYGGWASMTSMMKDRGIVVAEPQHGWIGPTHAAYNFGSAMYREPLRRTLPDELLTFGEYWGRGLRFPGRITAIGKPHIEKAAATVPMPVAARSEVLVVSSTADPDEMSLFVLSLREKLDSRWTVVFRPHPAERKVLSERYPRLMSVEGIRIDTGGDVYESLGTAAVVIGIASTVLFEALAFGCRVFVRDSALVDYYVVDRFGPTIKGETDLAKVANQINAHDLSQQHLSVASSDMWATGAVERFQEWLETVPRLESDPPH